MSRSLLLLALAAPLVLGHPGSARAAAQAAPPAAAQATPAVTFESIEGRDGNRFEAECGRLPVSERRGRKGSATIELAWMRVRSKAEKPGPPVFMLAGGPGGSSLEMLRKHLTGGGQMLLDLMGGDLVAVDQRGVGASTPNLDSTTLFDLPLEEPGDEAALLARIRKVCQEEAARWKAKGVDLAGYTTVESADDIDALREHLGYQTISLWGESYGTHLALATIRRHGEHISRAVLVGPEGPDQTIKLPSNSQQALVRVGELLKDDPTWGPRIPDLPGLVETLLGRLRAEPVMAEVDGQRVGISEFDLQWMLSNLMGSTRRGIDLVPATLAAMDAGDYEPFAGLLLEQRQEFGIDTAMGWVMDSASGVSKARAATIAAEAKTCLLGDAMDFPFPGVAAALGAPDLGEAYRGPLKSKVPILFITGDLDSRTPVSNAEELMPHLPNARLIVVENAAHDLNWVQTELREAWSAFLAGGEVTLERVTAPPVAFAPPLE